MKYTKTHKKVVQIKKSGKYRCKQYYKKIFLKKSNKEKNNEATWKHKNNDRIKTIKANRITMCIIWLGQNNAA